MPFDEYFEGQRYDRYEAKIKFDFLYEQYGLKQDLIRIIFEFSDEYDDEMMEEKRDGVKELFVCFNKSKVKFGAKALLNENDNKDNDEYVEMM